MLFRVSVISFETYNPLILLTLVGHAEILIFARHWQKVTEGASQQGTHELASNKLTLALLQLGEKETKSGASWLKRTFGKAPPQPPKGGTNRLDESAAVIATQIVMDACPNAGVSTLDVQFGDIPENFHVVSMFGMGITLGLAAILRDEGSEIDAQKTALRMVSALLLMRSEADKLEQYKLGHTLLMKFLKAGGKATEWQNNLNDLVRMYLLSANDTTLRKHNYPSLFGSMLKTILSAFEPPSAKHAPQLAPAQPPVSPPAALPVPPAPPPVPKLSWDDEMAASLDSLRKAVREKAKEEAQPLQDEIRDAESRLKAVRAIADKLGVTHAATAIAEEMRHWHSWSKNPNFDLQKNNLVEGLSYIWGEQTRDNRNETNINEFVFRQNKYCLTVAKEHMAYEGTDKYADLILEAVDESGRKAVFCADVSKDIAEDFALWHVVRVTMFEAGEWVHDIVLLHELFRVRHEQVSLRFRAEHILPKAKNV
jgi:hypothetical protein